MRNIFLIVMLLMILGACKDKKQTTESVSEKSELTKPDRAKDSTEIRETILSFYNWYNSNYNKLQKFTLYKGDRPPYKMNWPEVDRMHQYIHDSVPQLGEVFLKNQKIFLQEADSAFKVDVEDDIPYGFDWDWYTNSQEDPKYLLEEINKSNTWNYNINGDNAIVIIKGLYNDNGKQTETSLVKLDMNREKGKWKIAKIGSE